MNYFDPLADILSPAVLEAADKAATAAIHHGAAAPGESVVLHMVRTIVAEVRKEEQTKVASKYEATQRLVGANEASLRDGLERHRQHLTVTAGEGLQAYFAVQELLRSRAGRKTISVAELEQAMNPAPAQPGEDTTP